MLKSYSPQAQLQIENPYHKCQNFTAKKGLIVIILVKCTARRLYQRRFYFPTTSIVYCAYFYFYHYRIVYRSFRVSRVSFSSACAAASRKVLRETGTKLHHSRDDGGSTTSGKISTILGMTAQWKAQNPRFLYFNAG